MQMKLLPAGSSESGPGQASWEPAHARVMKPVVSSVGTPGSPTSRNRSCRKPMVTIAWKDPKKGFYMEMFSLTMALPHEIKPAKAKSSGSTLAAAATRESFASC
jgi:hypothetical protein